MLNFLELKTETAKLAQRSEDSNYVLKIGTFINITQQYVANANDYYQELMDVHNFSSVASTENYYMPLHFDKILRIYDITNDKPLSVDTEFNYFDGNIANIADSNTGIPNVARVYGVSGAKRTISSSGITTQAKSSSASDAGTIVRLEVFLDSSKTIIGYVSITVTGTSNVTDATTIYGIRRISKNQDTTGYITVSDSSGNVLAELGPTDRVTYYKVLKLGLIPAAAYNYRALIKQVTKKMVNDNDYPFIECDEFYILNSLGYCYAQEKETAERAQQVWAKAKDVFDTFLVNQANKHGPGYQHRIESTWMQAHRS